MLQPMTCKNPLPLAVVLAAVVGIAVPFLESTVAAGEFPLEVSETAGIRRRNDVITARLPVSQISDGETEYRVLRGGEPIPAQFRRVERPGVAAELVVDFIDHFDPFESRRYVVETGSDPDQRRADEPGNGLELSEHLDGYRIRSGGTVWMIRKDLQGLLGFSWRDVPYVAVDPTGLFVISADGEIQRTAGGSPTSTGSVTAASIERQGPIACALRFELGDWPPGASSELVLEFVRTKSWVRGLWTIHGDSSGIKRMGVDLQLLLDDPESLVDFGAGDFVYATVTREQATRLQAGPRDRNHVPWEVTHSTRDTMIPIVTASRRHDTPAVHGWAHVMDSRRCTALAVGRFGEETVDSINVDGRGRLAWTREWPEERADRSPRLEFWLHFVTMPVHIGARTSPRSMQEPLEVRWLTD